MPQAEHASTVTPLYPSTDDQRIELAGAILDRLDICRRLLRQEPIGPRVALTLQLLERTADDVAELAGRS